MSDLQEIYLGGMLSEYTLKVRRNLMLSSFSLLLILKGNIIAGDTTFLGIVFNPENKLFIGNIFSSIAVYYLIKFFFTKKWIVDLTYIRHISLNSLEMERVETGSFLMEM